MFGFTSSAQIVNRQVSLEFYEYPDDYLDKFTGNIQKVDKDDVLRAAKKYIKPENLIMVVVGDSESFDSPLDSFGKVTEISLEE